jgi:hypothetical protein
MASVRGLLNIQSLNELTYENQPYLHQETVTLRTELRTVDISFIKGITATLSNPLVHLYLRRPQHQNRKLDLRKQLTPYLLRGIFYEFKCAP